MWVIRLNNDNGETEHEFPCYTEADKFYRANVGHYSIEFLTPEGVLVKEQMAEAM